MRRGEGR
jgi:hypothetical protein